MSSPSELALDEQSFKAFYLATFKYSGVWYSVHRRDATDFSVASKMELVKFFHMPAVPGPRFTPAHEHGKYNCSIYTNLLVEESGVFT